MAPLILDLSEADEPREKVTSLLSSIYTEVERRRTPYLIIVEEADRFVPQNGDKVAIFGEIARRGRKRGVGLMVCTQRPSLVDKNILSQCGNQLIGKLVIRNDLQAVAQFFQGREAPKQLTTLPAGRFYAMGGLSPVPKLVSIREKETSHGGNTPKIVARVIKPYRAAATPVTQAGGTATVPGPPLAGIKPSFSEEDVPSIVKRDRTFIFFGKEETVSAAHLTLRPMVEVAVGVRTGILRKRVELRYAVLDGATGAFIDLDDTFASYPGLGPMLGLTAEEIEVLREMSADRDVGALDIANRAGVSREMLRLPLRHLEEKRLVRSNRAGRSRLYRRVYEIPEFRWKESELALEPFSSTGEVVRGGLSETKLTQVIKGLVPGSEVQRYSEFVYPLFRVEMVRGRKKRIVWLDGRNGKELRP